MAITSENTKFGLHGYRRSQFLYAMTYVAITFAVLAFLNIYSSKISQRLIYQSKEASLVEKCQLAADEMGMLETLSQDSVSGILSQMESLKVTRLIVTDQFGNALYDSVGDAVGFRVLLPEIMYALGGEEIYSGTYEKGVVICRSAAPVTVRDEVVGCVYMTEYDASQGVLIRRLQVITLEISIVLEVFVLLFSLIYSGSFSGRMDKIMNSMRIIQEGNYTHKVEIHGNDELTLLGQEVNDLTERLQKSEEKRSRFVSDASHEIKTPLASIRLLADSILQTDMDADTMREFVEDIGNEADRLNRMTSKLLTLTKIDSTPEERELEIILMHPTLKRCCRILAPTAEAAGVTIDVQLDENCPVLILEDDLYQIAFNLMENGIKYNTAGGTLYVRLVRCNDNAVLTFRDTGIGIPEEFHEHIFERFYRVDKARSRASGGSGLGLAIVRSIVHSNQGTVELESKLGQGTCFTVTFPIFDTEAAI